MCGIVGLASSDPLDAADHAFVARATRALAHRGPDAEQVWSAETAAFGHRRLSIIDLAGGSQPMSDPSGRWTITYNGEIYNYRDIARVLEGHGVRFRTKSDCEVLLHAYIVWGADACERFDGIFAVGIWDARERSLFLARDHMGVKPLLYADVAGRLIFASELKAILAYPRVRKEIDPTALSDFLSLGYVLSPKTILREVRKLPAATSLTWRDGRAELRRFWNLAAVASQPAADVSFARAAERLGAELTRVVSLQRVSDVPLGALLSGGLDSTAITHRLVAGGGPVNSFSIGFVEKTYSELPYARLAASALGTVHHDEVIRPDLPSFLPKLAWYLDEPFADTAAVPMFHLAALARRHVTVALSGEGGDECFGGYDTYIADAMLRWYRHVPNGVHEHVIKPLVAAIPVTRRKVGLDYRLKQFVAYGRSSHERGHYSWRLLFDEPEKAALLGGDVVRALDGYSPFDAFLDHYRAVAGAPPLHRAMYVDMQTWLDAMLVKVDRTSMAHGLEARVPLLDRRLIEFAFSLPPSYKLHGFATKRVLRRALHGQVPAAILRRKKRGFNAPVAHWTADLDSLRNGHDDLLPGLPSCWEQLMDAHHARRRDNGYRLWTLAQWMLWRRMIGEGVRP